MNPFTKNGFILFIMITYNPIAAMEKPNNHPQLQLKESENITVVTYYAMILECIASPHYDTSIKYATKSVHTQLNLPTTMKDPLMTFKIIRDLKNPSVIAFKKVIPLKHTFNLNDGSMLTTVKRTGAQLYPNEPALKERQFLVKIVCAKNPVLKKTSFAQDRNFAKKQFYKEQKTWIGEKDTQQELIDTQIIQKKYTEFMFTTNQGNKTFDVFEHGPNGISNDEAIRQSIIDEKIVPIRSPLILVASEEGKIVTNKSCFRSLRNRELTGSFRK